jgi:hypothetical protein
LLPLLLLSLPLPLLILYLWLLWLVSLLPAFSPPCCVLSFQLASKLP